MAKHCLIIILLAFGAILITANPIKSAANSSKRAKRGSGDFHNNYSDERENEANIRLECTYGQFYDIPTSTCKECAKFCPSGYCGWECKQYDRDRIQDGRTASLREQVESNSVVAGLAIGICFLLLLCFIGYMGYKICHQQVGDRQIPYGVADTEAHDKKNPLGVQQPSDSNLAGLMKKNAAATANNRDDDTHNTPGQHDIPTARDNATNANTSSYGAMSAPHQVTPSGQDGQSIRVAS